MLTLYIPAVSTTFFMKSLEQEGYVFAHETRKGRLTNVIFSHPRAIGLARHLGSDVIAMDTTFGTNKYSLPMLNIVGKDQWGKNYYIAQAWLSGEDERTYQWVLEQLISPRFLVSNL